VAASLVLLLAVGVPPTASRRCRGAVWLGLLAPAGAAALALRDPALVAPVAWAALWRATRGDGVAAAACAAGAAAGLAAGLARLWP